MGKLKQFTRKLSKKPKPTNHQRRFLYLPYPIFRDFTNIEEILSDKYLKKNGKKPPNFVLKKSVEKHFELLSQLDNWKTLGFDRLEFKPDLDGKEIEACVFSKDKKKQEGIHEKFSDFEKQFGYLPLHILRQATNLREILNERTYGQDDNFISISEAIHLQMHKKWAEDLLGLRFVSENDADKEFFEVTENVKTSANAEKSTKSTAKPTAKAPAKKSTEETAKQSKSLYSDPIPSTSKQSPIIRSPKKNVKTPSIPNASDRELKRRRINSNIEEVPLPKMTKETPKEQQAEDTPQRQQKQKQSTLPSWLSNTSKPKVVQEVLGVGKVPKMPKSTPKENQAKTTQKKTIVIPQCDSPSIESPSAVGQSSKEKSTEMPTDSLDINSNHEDPSRTPSTEKTHPSADQSLADRREYNAEDRQIMRESYTPSKFQQKILELDFEGFRTKTNIVDLIQEDYCKFKNDKDAKLSGAALNSRLEFYYEFRKRTREWYKNSIKNLEFKECRCKQDKSSNKSVDSSNKSQSAVKPTDFQKEIMAMDFETFVKETNIKDLVIRDFNRQFNGTKQITQEDMDFGLQQYDRYRKKPKTWLNNSLVDLKYTKCECKRNKQFVDESMQTEHFEIRDNERQCSSTDFMSSEPNQQQEQRQLQAVQSLSIRAIDNTELYHFRYILPTDEENQETQIQMQEQEGDQENLQTGCICLADNILFSLVPPSQIVNQSDVSTHYTPSQSTSGSAQGASGSTQGASGSTQSGNLATYTTAQSQTIETQLDASQLVPSQQIISLAEVRMSEFIESHPRAESEHAARNPLETQAVPENVTDDTVLETVQNPTNDDVGLLSQIISQFDPPINSTPVSSTVNESEPSTGLRRSPRKHRSTPKKQGDNSRTIKIKIEPASMVRPSPLDDSEIICLGTPSPPPTINIDDDETESEELFNRCLEASVGGVTGEISTIHSQSTSLQANTTKIETHSDLINILEGRSPVIEDSESPPVESPLRNIENILQQPEQPPSKVHIPAKRALPVPAIKTAATKKRKVSHDDSLRNIPVPKYNYGPLEFAVRKKTNNGQQLTRRWSDTYPKQIQMKPPEPTSDEPNYYIEDSSSTDESNLSLSGSKTDRNNGIVTNSCANLLNQDNTLFLDVNTQLIFSGRTSTKQLTQPSSTLTLNATIDDAAITNPQTHNQPEAVSIPMPGPSILSTINNDKTEFLHYIDITKVISKFKSIITVEGHRGNQLEIEATLQHQCNASNRIVVKADALKSIMKLTDKEWNAILLTLSKIEAFNYESKNLEPMNVSLLHRTMYFLFKTTSKISNVHIAYGDHDLETARVIHKSSYSKENITPAISQFVLSKMKETIQEQNKNK